jgi:class 3 adenylate cyclase
MAFASLPSGTVTFLFTDIEGSTARWDRKRAAMQAAVRLHDTLMRMAFLAHGGRVFKTMGDAFFVAFARPEDAAAAALEAQKTLSRTDFSHVDGLHVRMAIHTGTADERDGDYFGPAVNRVARILALGHGGQVLVSGTSANLLRENLPKGGALDQLGEYVLKDIERPEPVFQLLVEDLRREFPPLRAEGRVRPWLVPDAERTRCFAGRDDVLDHMHVLLKQRHRIVISGLGGIGKTQTALEFASRRRGEYANGVFWVNGETLGSLTAGYVEIAKALGLPGADASDQERTVQAALTHFESHSSWLLVLDNVEERRTIVPFVPRTLRGDVLITSREPVFPELGLVRTVELNDLPPEDATTFLLTRCGREDSAPAELAAAAELARELGRGLHCRDGCDLCGVSCGVPQAPCRPPGTCRIARRRICTGKRSPFASECWGQNIRTLPIANGTSGTSIFMPGATRRLRSHCANHSRPGSRHSGPIIPTWGIRSPSLGQPFADWGDPMKRSRSENAPATCLSGSSAPKVMTWSAGS